MNKEAQTMTLLDMVRGYEDLLKKKDDLAAQTKENNAAIEAAKAEIAQQMIDDDCPSVTFGGYSYSLQFKTRYSKRSDEDLAAEHLDFFDVLREEGFGSLIRETVPAQTLQSAIRDYVDEHGELTEELAAIVQSYEYNDIYRRKVTKKGAAK